MVTRPAPADGARTPAIERFAPRNGQQPGPERRLAAESAELAPGDDERVLGGVEGVVPVAKRRQGGAEHHPLVERDEIPEGVLAAGSRGVEQRGHPGRIPAFGDGYFGQRGSPQEVGDDGRHWGNRHSGKGNGWVASKL